MKDRTRILIICISLAVCIVYAGFELLIISKTGPEQFFYAIFGALTGTLAIIVESIVIIIFLSSIVILYFLKDYVRTFFREHKIWKIYFILISWTLALFALYKVLLIFGVTADQISLMPIFYVLPWIAAWIVMLCFFDVSMTSSYLLAALQIIVFGFFGTILFLLLDLLFITVIILSRNYISKLFKSRATWIFCLGFFLLAITLDIFYEISLQYGTPSNPYLWVVFLFRHIFFVPWILTWLLLIYFFEFSAKSLFFLAAIQGLIGELLLTELFFPGAGIPSQLLWDPITIILAAFLNILLYGCNLAVPYAPFEETFNTRLNRRNTKWKYLLSFIPLYAFCLAFIILQIAIQVGFPYL